jgi:hypothetical protein
MIYWVVKQPNPECCGFEMDRKDGQLSCCVCERTEAWTPEVHVGTDLGHTCLTCGEFSGTIEGDRFQLLVCSGYAGETWARALDLDDLAHLRALLARADDEIRRQRAGGVRKS